MIPLWFLLPAVILSLVGLYALSDSHRAPSASIASAEHDEILRALDAEFPAALAVPDAAKIGLHERLVRVDVSTNPTLTVRASCTCAKSSYAQGTGIERPACPKHGEDFVFDYSPYGPMPNDAAMLDCRRRA